jgi:hypothetical protein
VAEAPGSDGSPSWPRYVLREEEHWLLNLPGGQQFDASGLLRLPNGELWTINDKSPGVYRIVFGETPNEANLERVPGIFTGRGGRGAAPGPANPPAPLDCEGLALDEQNRLYICEESRRWIFRKDLGAPDRGLERLPIDWTPVQGRFHPTDRNASFEGIAVHGNRLYVANERQESRIIVVDLERMAVVDDFAVVPADAVSPDAHYSDLAWHEGSLWVLVRDMRRVLRVDPEARRVIAEFDFTALETRREVAYGSFFAPGFMEGLQVDDTHIWLIVDNNGFGRRANLGDRRPTLFKCARPDKGAARP